MKATQEPIIAEPDIIGGIKLNDSHRFLLLMSSGLYKAIEEAMGTDQVNKYLAQSVVDQVNIKNSPKNIQKNKIFSLESRQTSLALPKLSLIKSSAYITIGT